MIYTNCEVVTIKEDHEFVSGTTVNIPCQPVLNLAAVKSHKECVPNTTANKSHKTGSAQVF